MRSNIGKGFKTMVSLCQLKFNFLSPDNFVFQLKIRLLFKQLGQHFYKVINGQEAYNAGNKPDYRIQAIHRDPEHQSINKMGRSTKKNERSKKDVDFPEPDGRFLFIKIIYNNKWYQEIRHPHQQSTCNVYITMEIAPITTLPSW